MVHIPCAVPMTSQLMRSALPLKATVPGIVRPSLHASQCSGCSIVMPMRWTPPASAPAPWPPVGPSS